MLIKIVRRRRPDPSLTELYHNIDPVLHDMYEALLENISYGIKMNLSVKEDHATVLLWRKICVRYHLLKEVEVKTKFLQLSKELKVEDDEVLEISHDHVSYNFSILNELEVQSRNKTRKKPTFEEIDAESDFNLQFLWSAFKQSINEAKENGLSFFVQLLKGIYQRYFNVQDQKRKEIYLSAHVPDEKLVNEEPISTNGSTFG